MEAAGTGKLPNPRLILAVAGTGKLPNPRLILAVAPYA